MQAHAVKLRSNTERRETRGLKTRTPVTAPQAPDLSLLEREEKGMEMGQRYSAMLARNSRRDAKEILSPSLLCREKRGRGESATKQRDLLPREKCVV